MSTVLSAEQRRLLDSTVQKARTAAEGAAADALRALAVDDTHRPPYLTDQQNELRLALRAKARQLGDDVQSRGADLTLLVRDVAYEQWHRLLFARFLELNGLLMDPAMPDTPLSLEDCAELARDEGETDGWTLAARYAAQILPGVFRLDDPAFRVTLPAEHRIRLEQLLLAIPTEVFVAEDALGWVYQFWQTAEKKRVNDRGDKIGGADLSPVTQLFTENYMVRFLLENSLGAWWAGRHPDSPLLAGWDYLRYLDDGTTPAAGTFDEWPTTTAEVTVMDPCCGSGHFLVAMFGMLWRMRAEEEGLSPADAQDAVLRDNLFGLELDPRCTQIATFNVALEAWKQGGYRRIPTPQIACSGVPVRQSREEWLDGVPEHLHEAMGRLHTQFRNADTLGSLIDPRPAEDDMNDGAMFGRDMTIGVTWDQLRGHLAVKFAQEGAAGSVLGHATEDVVQSARLLSRTYTLIATNPPWLGSGSWSEALTNYASSNTISGSSDLAIIVFERCMARLGISGAYVLPQSFTSQSGMARLRREILTNEEFRLGARLGHGSFQSIGGQVVQPVLVVTTPKSRNIHLIDTLSEKGIENKSFALKTANIRLTSAQESLASKFHRISFVDPSISIRLGDIADFAMGIQTGDNERFTRNFWELSADASGSGWSPYARSPEHTAEAAGRSLFLNWNGGDDKFMRFLIERLGEQGVRSWLRGERVWGNRGVLVSRVGSNSATIYDGDYFADNAIVLTPKDPDDMSTLWNIVSDPFFTDLIDEIDSGPSVTGGTVAAVGIPQSMWRRAAESPGNFTRTLDSDDPTQWLFLGDIATSTQPLQVAMARLLGYRWPDQEPDDLDRFADADGIVTLPNLGEGDAASRVRALLAEAYGDRWTSSLEHTLVTDAGGKTGRLEDWLRDTFFAHHCKVFDNRPFLWHVWDGRKDGFSAIVHYHRLDRRTLEKLTYTSLGTWIHRQTQEVAAGTAGAEARLAAAQELKGKLEAIIEGEAPYDVFVRWKPLHEQPVGWDPDLDDGVRLNIRPFVTAGVLRSKVNVHWKKDRGKNPDGSERLNDLHPTLAERRTARAEHEAATA